MSTSPGNLPCKRVIHAVGPRWRSSSALNCEQELKNCVTNCFDQLEIEGFRSIAIPPISTGVFGFPIDRAAQVVIQAIMSRDGENKLPAKVVLIDNKQGSLHLYKTYLDSSGASPILDNVTDSEMRKKTTESCEYTPTAICLHPVVNILVCQFCSFKLYV